VLSNRPAVQKYLGYWQARVQELGAEHVVKELTEGRTVLLSSKDRRGLLIALGLR
jgi:hypothetical protein